LALAKWDAYYHINERTRRREAMGCTDQFNLYKIPLPHSRSGHISVSLRYSPFHARDDYGICITSPSRVDSSKEIAIV
jgi:hypothetical protein